MFQIKIVICNSLWLTYEGDYSHDTAYSTNLTILDILHKFPKLIILGTLGMTGHAHQNWWNQLIGSLFIHMSINNSNKLDPSFLSLKKYTLKNPAIWLAKSCSLRHVQSHMHVQVHTLASLHVQFIAGTKSIVTATGLKPKTT